MSAHIISVTFRVEAETETEALRQLQRWLLQAQQVRLEPPPLFRVEHMQWEER